MGTGYTRQSAGDILDGETVFAGPLNVEFNAIQAAFSGTAGHAHDGTTGEGPKINLTTSISGILPIANGGFSAIHNLSASGAPTTSNDETSNYGPGSIWVDTTNDLSYICLDATTASAIWKKITLSGTVDYQPLDADLTAIAALSGTGIAVRTASDTWAQRTLTGTANEVTVTNGSGASGNPTVSLPSALTFTGKTVTGGTFSGPTITSGTYTGSLTATSLDMQTNKITNLGTPTGDADAATKLYIDGLISALQTALAESVPVGTVIDYVGSSAPNSKWLFPYGQEISRSTYSALFAVIGTTFGVGNGSTTFNLPDYRGRVGAGKDNMGGSSADRLNTLSSTTLGAVGGSQTHTLTEAQLPSHSHTFSGTSSAAGGHSHSVSASGSTSSNGDHTHTTTVFNNGTGYAFIAVGSGGTSVGTVLTSTAGSHSHTVSVSGSTSSVGDHTHTYSGTTSSVGSGSAHNNIQPTIIVNKLIKVL